MKSIYEAANGVEAHMIVNLLEQQGIRGRVDGEFLQGAIGELPAAGLVKVLVSAEDYAAAKPIVDQWDKAQPPPVDNPPSKKSGSRMTVFCAGMVIGVLASYAYFHTRVSQVGADHNRDGVLDEKWNYASSGVLINSEVDRNLDGKIDYVADYGRDGTIESASFDDDFNGVFETNIAYRQGNPNRAETDTDGDGYNDFKTNFAGGVAVSTEYINPTTGLPRKVEHFRLGKRTYTETDTNNDGTLDQRADFDELGDLSATTKLKP